MKRKRRTAASVPIMLFWSKRDQRRFIDAVERFNAILGDLEILLAPKKRKAAAAAADHPIFSDESGRVR